MASIARPKLRENGGKPMSKKLSAPAAKDQGWDSLSEPAGRRAKAVPAAWWAQPWCSTEAIEERRWLRSLVRIAKTEAGR
jgi:hypothetical protein